MGWQRNEHKIFCKKTFLIEIIEYKREDNIKTDLKVVG
jgi:hypothetical protein